jgi:pSer/pThr/pTyr-binding forkhead associated (FHA) protein
MTTPPAIRLTLTVHGATPRPIAAGPLVLIGSGLAADVRVPDDALAPVHLRLERDGGRVVALAAAPGVTIDGDAIAPGESRPVDGQTIAVGRVTVVAVPAEAAGAVNTDSLARELMRDLLGAAAPPPPELVVERGPNAGALRPLPAGARIVVGRGADADWVVLDPELSRAHLGVAHREDGVYAWDLGGKNRAVADGEPLPRGEPGRLLAEGARLTLGGTVLRLRDPAAAALAERERGLTATEAGGAVAAPTLTRDLRGPAARAAAASASTATGGARRWPLVVSAAIAVVAAVLAIVVLATW